MAKSKEATPKALPGCTLKELEAQGPLVLYTKVNGQEVVFGTANPRAFSTGSYGYGLNGKVNLVVANKAVRLQLSCNCTVIGSKEAPAEYKLSGQAVPTPEAEQAAE